MHPVNFICANFLRPLVFVPIFAAPTDGLQAGGGLTSANLWDASTEKEDVVGCKQGRGNTNANI